MVDPFKPIKFNRTRFELEEFLLFSICVAGKKATRVAKAVDQLMSWRISYESPLQCLDRLDLSGQLQTALEEVGVGQYARITQAIRELIVAKLDLAHCAIGDLEGIHGIGPKTARMFVMFTRPNQRHAIIDTHILKFLRQQGLTVPKNTPSSRKQYLALEREFLKICDRRGLDPAQFDLQVWTTYAQAA